jgi:hypothetical protein
MPLTKLDANAARSRLTFKKELSEFPTVHPAGEIIARSD